MTWKEYANFKEIRENQKIYDQQKWKRDYESECRKQREIEHQKKLKQISEKTKLKQEKLDKRKQQEEFRGEYMDYNCPSCDGKLKIVYTKWSASHFAKSICESCDRFDRWLPKPKPDNEFK